MNICNHLHCRDHQMKNIEIYHKHYHQIIVSKAELKYQLDYLSFDNELIPCLVFGKSHPDYRIWLLKASSRFQLISSFFYPLDDKRTSKLPPKYYEKMFDNSLESKEKAEDWLKRLHYEDNEVYLKKASELLQKYIAVKQYCLRMLASRKEAYFAEEYAQIIDYIVTCFPVPSASFKNNSDFPEFLFKLEATYNF